MYRKGTNVSMSIISFLASALIILKTKPKAIFQSCFSFLYFIILLYYIGYDCLVIIAAILNGVVA